MVETLVNFWDHPKFSRPTDAVGDWHFARSVSFESAEAQRRVEKAESKLVSGILRMLNA